MTKAKMLASLAVGGLFFGTGLFIMGFIGKTTSVHREIGLRSAVGAQDPRQTTIVDGVTLAYTDSGGPGLTIICLHAIGHGARDFEDLTRRMAFDYRIIAIDFPGQGNSGNDLQSASGTRYPRQQSRQRYRAPKPMGEPGLSSSRLSDVADTDCSEQIRQARTELLGAGYQRVRTVRWNASHVAFAFVLKVDIPTGGTVGNVDIRPEEPILLVFNQQNYPFSCPRAYSDRTDFPVSELPHINPTTKSIPAYLCLHRGNLDDWFAEHTVCDLVTRIRGWFRDAASGRLIREDDRFEATRIESALGICVYDDDQFCRYVENEWKSLPGSGGTSFIIGDLLRDFSQDPTKDVGFAWAAKFPVKDTPSDLVEKAHRVHAYLAESAPGDNRIIFGILVWPSAEPVARYFGSLPGDFKGLEEFAVSLGLGLKEALASYAKNDLRIIGGIPILIAIPRPQKLIGANSATEFLSFVILGNKENRQANGELSPEATVSILEHRRPVTRKFARYLSSVSGAEKSDPRILLLGCGAQGSKLGLHLGKAGFTNIDFADHASLSPHNLIRHALLPSSLGKNKAEALRDELDILYYADSTKAFSARRSGAIEILRDQHLLDNVDLLIDATASGLRAGDSYPEQRASSRATCAV
ncbi:MAG: ThiF family adenylyltransferase [Candidatus Sulfotelmatobacter sp.]